MGNRLDNRKEETKEQPREKWKRLHYDQQKEKRRLHDVQIDGTPKNVEKTVHFEISVEN